MYYKREVKCNDILKKAIKIIQYSKSKEKQTVDDLKLNSNVDSSWYHSIPKKSAIDYLRVSSSLTKQNTLQMAGAMRVMYKNNTTVGKHKVEFLPIIDLPLAL